MSIDTRFFGRVHTQRYTILGDFPTHIEVPDISSTNPKRVFHGLDAGEEGDVVGEVGEVGEHGLSVFSLILSLMYSSSFPINSMNLS